MSRYLVGRAVPYDTPTPVYEPDVGAYYETFQRGSLTADVRGSTVPLLFEHVGSQPVGRIRRTWERDDGLWAEALLAGRVAELEDLVANEVTTGLSIGFLIDSGADEWTRTASGVPHVTRRGARLKELSVTWRPTYSDAVITGVQDHSSDWAGDRALVTELTMWRAADRVRQARLWGDTTPVRAYQPGDPMPPMAPPLPADPTIEDRVGNLEARTDRLEARVGALEGPSDGAADGVPSGGPTKPQPRARLRRVS
jgi:HK97 family phage prohead protease